MALLTEYSPHLKNTQLHDNHKIKFWNRKLEYFLTFDCKQSKHSQIENELKMKNFKKVLGHKTSWVRIPHTNR